MSALIQGLLMRVAMSIMMIALLQKHIVVCEHVSTSYLAEQEKLNPLSLETVIVLPNGKSTSASLTNRKESSSLSKSKYNSEYNEKPRDITSYRTVLTTSRVDWKDEKKHHMNQSNGKDANDRSNASDNDISIKPFQEELTFVVSTSRQASQTSYDSMKSGPVDYTIFDKHMNDPDFQLNPKNTILVLPLVQNSEFKHLSALCNKSGTGASNDANSRKDKERSTHPPPHGVNQGDGPDGHEASATDMNHKIKGRFRLTSYLLDFSWSDVTDVSGAYEKDQVERSKENEETTVWIASCPKNIICMEKQGQWFLSKSSNSSATSTPPPTGSTSRPHVQINTDYDKTSDKNFSSDSATMTNDFITKSPPTTKPTKRLVKVSKSEAFSLAYECHTIQKFRDTGESRVESGDESNVTTVLFTLDIFSAIKAWLSKHSNCQLEFSRSFVFSLKIDEIVDDDVMTLPLPSSHNGLQTSSATEFSELFSHNGKEHAVFSLEYTIDARCALPVSEACPVGKCSSADYIYKFRPECSPAKTGISSVGLTPSLNMTSAVELSLLYPWKLLAFLFFTIAIPLHSPSASLGILQQGGS
ncbi:unnamed protein product [Orchesella dallaii]|uniref:Uncharacterized protein n=1 Tax=Orchesella dallaii TaxID=48710 RepID=A0ABP1QE75_9HEXA